MALTLLVFGVGQYGAWVALVGQATNDVEPTQYGVASGIFKTSTHIGSAPAVAISAAVIRSAGGADTADAYALAYLSAAVLTLAGAVMSVRLLRPPAKRTPRWPPNEPPRTPLSNTSCACVPAMLTICICLQIRSQAGPCRPRSR